MVHLSEDVFCQKRQPVQLRGSIEEWKPRRTFRHETIIKNKFTCVATSHSKLVKFLMRGKTFEGIFNDKRSDSS